MFSNAAGSGGVLPAGAVDFFKRRLTEIFAALLFLSAAWLLFAIISYSPSDPSFNSVGNGAVGNLLGTQGALGAQKISDGAVSDAVERRIAGRITDDSEQQPGGGKEKQGGKNLRQPAFKKINGAGGQHPTRARGIAKHAAPTATKKIAWSEPCTAYT